MPFLHPCALLLGLLEANACSSVLALILALPVVDLGYGTYHGTFNSTAIITTFFGIRYATPPTGTLQTHPTRAGSETFLLTNAVFLSAEALRFQAPAPPTTVSGVQTTDTQLTQCLQGLSGMGVAMLPTGPQPVGEDCLFLKYVVLVPSH